MKYSRLLLVSIVCVAVLPVLAQNIPPQTITQLKTYYPDTTLVREGQAECVIVYPDEDGYADLAQQVASAIKGATGAEVPLKTDEQYTKADRDTNLICLGQMNNNKLALDLYIFHYIACDDWFPGPGDDEHPPGFVVRSCCDPWGNGKNVMMLGGTELDGVRLAVEHFKGMIAKGKTLTIPRTVKVQFKGIENLDEFAKTIEPYYHENFIDLKALPYGAEYRMVEAAERYFLTGRDEYLKCYALIMRRWMDEYYKWVPGRQITTPKYIIPVMILSYDQIEESSLLPDDLKLELTNLLYDYVSRMSVHGRIRQLKPGVLATTGHHNVSQTVVYGARYFKQYYPDADFERIDRGMASVQTGQETICATYGFFDLNGGYTDSYPTTAMLLSLAMDNMNYFASGNARKWMEYSILITSPWGGCPAYFSPSHAIAAWYYQDPTYVWEYNMVRATEQCFDPIYLWEDKVVQTEYYPEMTPESFEHYLWTYLPNLESKPPLNMVGLHYIPVQPTVYAQLQRKGKFVNVPQERTFHQLSMRDGFGHDSQYLRIDGINSGIAKGGDGNSIGRIVDGRPWLVSGSYGSSSMKFHPTCLVLKEGQMMDKLVALCDLQLAADLPNSCFVRSVMHEYNGLDWARDIIWIKGKYWVVFDHMQVIAPGDYSIFCQWRTGVGPVDDDFRYTYTRHNHTFVIQSAGGNKPQKTLDKISVRMDDRVFLRQGLHGHLNPGDEPTFANLLYGHHKDLPHDYSIKRLTDNTCLVTEPERHMLVGVAPLGKPDELIVLGPQMQLKCTMFALAPGEMSFGGLTSFAADKLLLQAYRPVDLAIDLAQGLITINARQRTKLRVRGLQISQATMAAAKPTTSASLWLEPGEHQFQVDTSTSLLADLAQTVRNLTNTAAKTPPGRVEVKRPEYPNQLVQQWQFKAPAGEDVNVLTIESADLDGDGRVESFAGTSDGRMFCLGPDGALRWEFAAQGAINDIAVADFGAGPRVLAASDDMHLYCLDAAGNQLWTFTGQGIECTNQTRGTYGTGRYVQGDGEIIAVAVADINADGTKDILVGSKTFIHGASRIFGTLWCLNSAGELQWHLYQSGGNVSNIVPFDPTGDGQLHIAFGTIANSRSTYVCDNQGKLVVRHGSPYGDKAVAVGHVAADGSLRQVRLELRSGIVNVYEVSDPYELKWSYAAGGLSAAGPEVADLSGDGIAEILVGSGGGSLYCLNEADEPLTWRLNLGEPITVIGMAQLTAGASQIVAGASTGGLHLVSGDGTPLARAVLDALVTCVTPAQLNADGAQSLLAATKNGTVTAFVLQ